MPAADSAAVYGDGAPGSQAVTHGTCMVRKQRRGGSAGAGCANHVNAFTVANGSCDPRRIQAGPNVGCCSRHLSRSSNMSSAASALWTLFE